MKVVPVVAHAEQPWQPQRDQEAHRVAKRDEQRVQAGIAGGQELLQAGDEGHGHGSPGQSGDGQQHGQHPGQAQGAQQEQAGLAEDEQQMGGDERGSRMHARKRPGGSEDSEEEAGVLAPGPARTSMSAGCVPACL